MSRNSTAKTLISIRSIVRHLDTQTEIAIPTMKIDKHSIEIDKHSTQRVSQLPGTRKICNKRFNAMVTDWFPTAVSLTLAIFRAPATPSRFFLIHKQFSRHPQSMNPVPKPGICDPKLLVPQPIEPSWKIAGSVELAPTHGIVHERARIQKWE